ncbi:hypothetical protein ACN20G_11770 [Streptomyces sp. BI20]|uniref:hypothetical protein n=1 Tax=Streptomyces sp. BI20 TaxID=3403460 RepID=UPI003C772162
MLTDPPAPASTTSPSAGPTSTSPVARGRVKDGVPVGHPHTGPGARAAAANYVTVLNSPAMVTSTGRARSVAVMTADSGKEMLQRHAAEAGTRLRAIDTAGGDPSSLFARTGVLSSELLGVTSETATVRLWVTTVAGHTTGRTVPASAFRSVTVGLRWERADWKVASISDDGGLVPSADVRQATNAPADFDRVSADAADPIAAGTADADGVPAPYDRTDAGARAAATTAAQFYGDPRFYASAQWRHRMLTAITSAGALPTARSDADRTADLVVTNRGLGEDGRTADGGLLITRTAVLSTRMVSYSPSAAAVELWTASVGGVAGDTERMRPQVSYLRMAVDLVWERGSWRVTNLRASEPLVPTPATATAVVPASAFAAVGGVDHAPATS